MKKSESKAGLVPNGFAVGRKRNGRWKIVKLEWSMRGNISKAPM